MQKFQTNFHISDSVITEPRTKCSSHSLCPSAPTWVDNKEDSTPLISFMKGLAAVLCAEFTCLVVSHARYLLTVLRNNGHKATYRVVVPNPFAA